MIEAYRFGEMLIDGQRYRSDLLIFPDGSVVDHWRRTEGHRLTLTDIRTLLDTGARTLVAGTGANGRMVPAKGLAGELLEKGIELVCAPCNDAIEHYNRILQSGQPLAGCFHLTC